MTMYVVYDYVCLYDCVLYMTMYVVYDYVCCV